MGELVARLAGLGYPGLQEGALPAISTLGSSEFRDTQGRSLRLELAPLLPADGGAAIGWLLSLTDLSLRREAEEQRAVLLRFLFP